MTAAIRPLVRGARRREQNLKSNDVLDYGAPNEHLLLPIRVLAPGETIHQVSIEAWPKIPGPKSVACEIPVELIRLSVDIDAWMNRRAATVLREEVVARAVATTSPTAWEPIEVAIVGVAEPTGDAVSELRTHFLRVRGAAFVYRIVTWVTG